MDAGLFGGFQFGFISLSHPLAGDGLIAKADGADGSGGIGMLAGFAAGRICTEQAARSFFVDMHRIIGQGAVSWITWR